MTQKSSASAPEMLMMTLTILVLVLEQVIDVDAEDERRVARAERAVSDLGRASMSEHSVRCEKFVGT